MNWEAIAAELKQVLPGEPLRRKREQVLALFRGALERPPGGIDEPWMSPDARADLWRRFSADHEEEQHRLLRELHASPGQNLSAILLLLNELSGEVRDPKLAARVQRIREVAETVGRDLHRITIQLRPAALDDFGLVPAVTSLAENWSQEIGCEVALHTSGFVETRLPAEVETALYRIVDEALSNVAKHARASRVAVILEQAAADVCAIVEDNGCGFKTDSRHPFNPAQRPGLAIMTERAALLGGQLRIESARGRGTTIIARLPLRTKDGG